MDCQPFKIYYADGTVLWGPPLTPIWEYPYDGVVCIAWGDPEKGSGDLGRVVLEQWDIYIYSDGLGWHGTNKYKDLLTHLGARGCGVGGVRSVLSGFWVPRSEYVSIIESAKIESGFDRKSACDPIREEGTE